METRIAFSVNIFTEIESISGILRPYIYANQSKKSKKNIFLLLFDIALPRIPQDKEATCVPPKKKERKNQNFIQWTFKGNFTLFS